MKFKKIVSGMLACALVAASLVIGSAATAKADTADTKANEENAVVQDPFSEIPNDFNPTVGEKVSMMPGETKSVKGDELPDKVKDAIEVKYESQTPDIATVDENGNVTAKDKLGYALIITRLTALSDGYMQEYYTLVEVDVDLSGVKASAKATSLAKGKTTTVSVSIPSSIKNSTKTYRATGAVSIDKSGKITAKSSGTGKVSVKVSSKGKSIVKKITVKVGEITGDSTVKAGKSITLSVKGLSGKAKWSLDSKGKKLAKITSGGKLTAKKNKAGTVTVTAKVSGVTMTKKVKVTKK